MSFQIPQTGKFAYHHAYTQLTNIEIYQGIVDYTLPVFIQKPFGFTEGWKLNLIGLLFTVGKPDNSTAFKKYVDIDIYDVFPNTGNNLGVYQASFLGSANNVWNFMKCLPSHVGADGFTSDEIQLFNGVKNLDLKCPFVPAVGETRLNIDAVFKVGVPVSDTQIIQTQPLTSAVAAELVPIDYNHKNGYQ